MASWPTGIDTIKELIAAGNLEKVAPSLEAVRVWAPQCRRGTLRAGREVRVSPAGLAS